MATVNVTQMVWYDPTKSPDENYNIGVQYYADQYPDITLQSDEIEAEMLACYAQLRVMEVQVGNKIKTFQTAKNGAFLALSESHDVERQALGVLWQAKEDNDYDVDYTPT